MIFSSHRSFRNQPTRSALLGLALVTALSGCAQKEAGGGGGRGGRGGGGAAPVITGQAQRKVVPLVVDAIGTVEPIKSATVRAQITGTLFKIDLKEGQDVAQGDLLFEIDPRPFENSLRSALADQQKIAAQLDTARAQLARYKSLSVGAMISQDQLQQIQDSARALEAQAAAADAAVSNAKLQLSYCSIRAPIAGRTGNLSVHEGDLIRANDVGALVTINQLSPIYVTFAIAQQHLPAITRYRSEGTLKVEVEPGAGEPHVAAGELTFVDNTVDPTTGTIKLKATFSNDQRRLWPGLFGTVTVTLATPEVLTVPASAIQNSQTGQHVYVVKEDKTAELRPVTVERTTEDVAVITKGLAAGERVVVDGQLRVVPGRPVDIKSPDVLNNPGAAHARGEGGTNAGGGEKRKKKQGT